MGGLKIYHEIREYLLELLYFLSKSRWLQALFRAYDSDFMWDVTRGKPRAASSEGMEGQDKIEINKIEVINGGASSSISI